MREEGKKRGGEGRGKRERRKEREVVITCETGVHQHSIPSLLL